MRKLLLTFVALMLSFASAPAQTASEILARVTSVYATCQTYSDEAISKSTLSQSPERSSYFRTRFVRQNAFRFELWLGADKPGKGTHWIVGKNGAEVVVQGISTRAIQRLHFDSALWVMSSSSGGGSLLIPQLLLPDDFRTVNLLTLIANAKVSGEEEVDGRPAFVVEGTVFDRPLRLWIDKTQFLILKSFRQLVIGNRLEESTVRYKPKVNSEIPSKDLVVTPAAEQSIVDQAVAKLPASGSPPILAPKLRTFGSSLRRDPNEKAAPSAERTANDDDVVRIETDLVLASVLVVDSQGRIVRGLTKEDFIVKEDDKLQEVTILSLGDNKDLPRSIVLIIDYSGSQLPYIKTSIESAKMLVDKLNPKDRMAIVTDDVQLLVDFTSDKQRLKTALEALKTSALAGQVGASEQYDALMATLNEAFNNEDMRPVIIFQTDGDQLNALKDGKRVDTYTVPRKYSFEDILTATEKSHAAVYSVLSGVKFFDVPEAELPQRARLEFEYRQTVMLDAIRARNLPLSKETRRPTPPDSFFVDYFNEALRRQTALVKVAKFTGTLPEFLENPGQADEIYTRILTDIDRRYLIGYYPTNRVRDGKRRRVSIEVRGHPDYSVLGQKSYFAKEK